MTLSIVVEGNLGRFVQGQTVANAEAAEYLRAAFNEGADEDAMTTLTDEEILAIASSVSMDGRTPEEWESEVMELIEEGAVPEPSGELAESLTAVRDKINADTATTNIVEGVVAGQEKVDSGPIHIYGRLILNFKTPAERAIIPVPGSTDGNNPDIVKRMRQKTNGEWGEVKISNIKDLVSQQVTVAAKQKLIDNVKGSLPQGVKLGLVENRAVKRYTAQRSAASRAIIRAIRVMHQMDAIDECKHVGAELEMETAKDGTQQITKSKYCIKVFNRNTNGEGNVIAVSTFIAMKLHPGMFFKDLLASAKKARKPKGNVDKVAVVSGNILQLAAKEVNALETPAIYSEVTARLNKETAETNHELLTVGRIADLWLSVLDSSPTLRQRLVKLRQAERAQGNAPEQNQL